MNNDPDVKSRARMILGGKCSSPDCKWQNEDGTFGCNDERALHFDHIYGNGSEKRRNGKDSTRSVCYEIIRDAKYGTGQRFRLLCATCHEIRRKAEGQAQEARQHKHPDDDCYALWSTGLTELEIGRIYERTVDQVQLQISAVLRTKTARGILTARNLHFQNRLHAEFGEQAKDALRALLAGSKEGWAARDRGLNHWRKIVGAGH